MNTLLPFPDFTASAECLDNVRLNKQRSDVVQILKALAEPVSPDSKEHGAVKMWRGNEQALIRYGMTMCVEWQSRGNQDATLKKILAYRSVFSESSTEDPEWLGDERLHLSHRASLLRLKPTFYRAYWPDLSDEPQLFWPRSPERSRRSPEDRESDRLYRKAVTAQKNRDKAVKAYEDACEAAGIDPETFELMDGSEAVEIGVPDPDLLDL